jgi:hypothetical protein
VLKTDGVLNAVGGLQVNGVPVAATSATQTVQITPADPAGVNSTTPVMMGFGSTFKLTPQKSGVVVTVTTTVKSSGNCFLQVRYGTGTAPAYGAGAAGTQIGATLPMICSGGKQDGVHFTGLASVTPGTAYWFDAAIYAPDGSTPISVQGTTLAAWDH